MSSYPIDVINQALHAHDPDCAYWLERVNALLRDPANGLHRKALEHTRDYLEDASGLIDGVSGHPPSDDCQ
ncbi:MAG: hypothetical protein JSS57_01020 [Proteobacteria bacterium]|nr:hypothetical protein [Pseudomonadota bacterium]RTL26902.1 MAG: hypothetical protein EKK49_17810 [Rhodocyclaceae bacterium]